MESKRQQKFSRLIQKDLSDIFQKEGYTLFSGALVTVTIVRMAPDLGLARAYLSILPEAKSAYVMEKVDANLSSIRKSLGDLIRNQVRKVPEIRFYLDDTESEVDNMNQLLNKLNIKPKKEDDKE